MSCVRGCCPTQALHYKSVTLNAGPTATAQRETTLATDLAAYKRLRANGQQPPSFTNAALLEGNAKISQEVEQGILLSNDRMRREVADAHANAVITPIGGDAA